MMPQTGASLRQIATVLYGNRNSGRVNSDADYTATVYCYCTSVLYSIGPHTDVTPHFDALLAENSLSSELCLVSD